MSAVRSPTGLAVGALTLVGAVLRFTRIGHQGFWFDEGNTALLVSFSPGKMLGLIPQSESTPPLYYLLAWAWSRGFGHGEAGLRSLSALAGVLVIPVAYGATAKLVSRRAGLIVAALTACNPFLIWYAQEARSYSLLVLFSSCSLLAFAYARADPRPRRLALWVIACALALLTHYYAVVVVVPQAAWLLFEHPRARRVLIAIGAVAVSGLALLPLAITQADTGNDNWIAHQPLGMRLRQILPQFLIGTDTPERQLLKFTAFALALIGLVLLSRPRGDDGGERRGALIAGLLAGAGFLLALLFVAAGQDTLITRNVLGLWLPAAAVVGGGLAATGCGPRLRGIGVAAAAGLCVIGVIATVAIATDRSLQRPDWRYVSRVLGPPPSTPDVSGREILIQRFRTLLPLSLYQPRLHELTSRDGATVRELDIISMVAPNTPLCWWGAACNLIASEMQPRYAIPGFHEAWRRHVLQWTVLRIVAARPVRLTPQMVAAALHTTSLRRDELLIQRRG